MTCKLNAIVLDWAVVEFLVCKENINSEYLVFRMSRFMGGGSL
jgi:hypothetical protein